MDGVRQPAPPRGQHPNRQNGLALALRELGRIQRTLFTLERIQSPELRRRVHLGLNKGEARNSLARAPLEYSVLEQAAAALEWQGTPVPANCLPHLSPLGWEPISLTGDYILDLRQSTTLQRLRALRHRFGDE